LHNGQKPHFIDWLIEAIAGITFLGMVAFAVIVYFQTKSFEAIIPFVFGVLEPMAFIEIFLNTFTVKQKLCIG
jgi:hypothetical protein